MTYVAATGAGTPFGYLAAVLIAGAMTQMAAAISLCASYGGDSAEKVPSTPFAYDGIEALAAWVRSPAGPGTTSESNQGRAVS